MNKQYLNFEQLANHPLFELAKVEIIREGKIPVIKRGNKLIYNIKNPNLLFIDILIKMLSIVDVANKQGQKEKLDNYIKERLNDRKI
jgi:hypothetical protein